MEEQINLLFTQWQKRNIEGSFCAQGAQALDLVLSMIPPLASVGFSGSQTLEEMGLIRALEARGQKVYNQMAPGLSPEQRMEVRRQSIQADYYLTSANAVSLRGELVFFSAWGHRTAGIAMARHVIVVCGINKITADLGQALARAREYATPLNCRRLEWNSACVKDGICRKEICLLPEFKRMCAQLFVIEAEMSLGRLKVVMVGESLGF